MSPPVTGSEGRARSCAVLAEPELVGVVRLSRQNELFGLEIFTFGLKTELKKS